jgi:hypothetical protein
MIFRTKSKIPGWFVALAVVVTGGLTAWAIFKKSGDAWPAQSPGLPMQITEAFSPAVAAMNPRGFRRVAGTGQAVPVIRTGSSPKHGERGACTLCHVVVDTLGKAIPSIQAMARVPHQYQGGLCINCHAVTPNKPPAPGGGAFGTLAAGNAPPSGPVMPPAGQVPVAAQPPAAPAAARQPSEGAWLGMEVVPITNLTASQYSIPPGVRGLVVAEAEGQAAVSGVQAGDVLVAINGLPVGDMRSFLQATQNGTGAGGSVDVMRSGKFIKVILGQAPVVNGQPQPIAQQTQPSPAQLTTPTQPPAMADPSGLGGGRGLGLGGGRGLRRQQNGGTCPNGLR